MKKFVCIILAIIILMPMLPAMAAGDTTANASNAYFRVGNAYYSTFGGALADAVNSSDRTVYLLKDASISEANLTVPAGADITVDFGGHTLSVNNTGNYLISHLLGKLTVKNGNLNVVKGIVVEGGGHLIVERMNYNVVEKGSNARPAVKLSYAGNTKLTVKDSHLKTVGPGESLVLAEFATDAVINLEGSTVLEYAGVLDSETQNCGAIAVQQAWGTGFNSNSESANTDLVLNMGANAKIVNTAPSNDKAEYVASAITLSTSGDVTLNLEEGATLEIDRASGASKSTHINMTKYTANLTVNDKGANWSASAKTLKDSGIYFTNLWTEGYRIIGWTDGKNLVKTNVAYSVKDAKDTVIYKPVCFNDGDFDMIDGASIRTVQTERAIRFSTVVSDELITRLGDNVKFVTAVTEGNVNPSEAEGKVYTFKNKKLVPYESGKSVFHAALVLNGEATERAAYKKTLSAISYMTVKYYDGTEETFYTKFDSNNVRSMKQVADNLSLKGVTHSIIDYIFEIFYGAGSDPMLGDSLLVGYCTVDSLYNSKFDSSYWHAAGMGYIVKTADGKLIAIDGGNTVDAQGFYTLLREYSTTKDVVTVDYWILTHPHGDHVNALVAITSDTELKNKIDIKNLVFHFPTDFDTSTRNYNDKMQSIAEYYGADIINPKKGQVINIGEAVVTFLFVADNYKSYNTANKLSLIFTVELDKNIMFTGDIYEEGLKAAYNEYGSALKCDILQMPHHFLADTGYKPFYEMADASSVLLPTCIAGYNAMYTLYKNNSKHKANDWAAENADYVYKAFDGTFEIKV
ncbi:MAG: MBL fold metallo-hydrolase [Ruminococcaceae bacterium]|nr:MBL fold metallo-hydrolase [Oscillospiraceae bacterium]